MPILTIQFSIVLEIPTSEIMERKKGRKKKNEGRKREEKESQGI